MKKKFSCKCDKLKIISLPDRTYTRLPNFSSFIYELFFQILNFHHHQNSTELQLRIFNPIREFKTILHIEYFSLVLSHIVLKTLSLITIHEEVQSSIIPALFTKQLFSLHTHYIMEVIKSTSKYLHSFRFSYATCRKRTPYLKNHLSEKKNLTRLKSQALLKSR